jgi:hypothetical protein
VHGIGKIGFAYPVAYDFRVVGGEGPAEEECGVEIDVYTSAGGHTAGVLGFDAAGISSR